MITIANINQRIAYIEKVQALYQNEKDTLLALTQIYRDPIYKDVRELEKLIEHDKTLIINPIPVVMPESRSLGFKIGPASPEEARKELFEHYDKKKGYARIMDYMFLHTNTTNNGKYHEISLIKSLERTKQMGVSINTLTDFIYVALEAKHIRKTDKRGVYQVLHDFHMYIKTTRVEL